jgi:predicted secreted hydrolase
VKAPVLQHGDGYTDYSFGGNTYYYSRERMAATGTIVAGGETLPVTGLAWFDHQYGDLDTAIDTGWDWFAIQLDDQREIMLYVVRPASGDTLVGGSISDPRCVTTEIGPSDFEITPLGSWTRPGSSPPCTYPSGWTVRAGGLNLTVTPVLDDQELDTAVIDYWEGAATVSGDATGRAYVELTGYCP